MACCRVKGVAITLAVLGLVLLVIGLVAKPALNAIMTDVIKKDVVLDSPKSQFYEIWQNSSKVPIFMTFYLYNVSNPDGVKHHGEKPKIHPVGPFNYNELRVKHNIEWSPDRTTVRYMYNRTFHLMDKRCPPGVLYPDFECTIPDDILITTGNIPLMGLANQIENLPLNNTKVKESLLALVQDFVISKFPSEDTFITRPAREIIFGYNDTILETFNNLIEELNKDINGTKIPLLPATIQIQENNTRAIWTKPSEIYTGKDNVNDLYNLIAWAGRNRTLGFWAGSRCPDTQEGRNAIHWANMLNGSDGTAFRPNIHESTVLYVYSEDLRRSALLHKTNEITFKGVPLWRYRIADNLLDNVTMEDFTCAFDAYGPAGVLNLTNVVGGPVFASKPNFLDADPRYRSWVIGMGEPNRTLDDTTIDVEPHTGASMNIHQRLQVNVHIHQVPRIHAFENVTQEGFYLPILRVDEHGAATDDLVHQWKSQVGIALKARDAIHMGGIVAGPVVIALCLALVIAVRCRHERQYGADVGRVNSETTPLMYEDPDADGDDDAYAYDA